VDLAVELVTDEGTITSPVTIPARSASTSAIFTASRTSGPALIRAKAKFLSGDAEVELL
jgi:hypothetical protein